MSSTTTPAATTASSSATSTSTSMTADEPDGDPGSAPPGGDRDGDLDADGAAAVLAVAAIGRGLERALDEMTLAQYRVLTMIGSSPQRAGRLAERAALSKSTLTGLLDGLHARGWVRRTEVAGDRRGVGLELTAEGRTAREQAEAAMVGRLDHYLGFASEPDRATAAAGLAVLHRCVAAAWEGRR